MKPQQVAKPPAEQLRILASRWQEHAFDNPHDNTHYKSIMDDLLFHGGLQFQEYVQFKPEGDFPTRLLRWINNSQREDHQKALFALARRLVFINRAQMHALYQDAYRRILVPWLTRDRLGAQDLLSCEYYSRVLTLLKSHRLFSITESFNHVEFIRVNDLVGLARPQNLGGMPGFGASSLFSKDTAEGIIIFEDFVGTGNQASEVLRAVCHEVGEAGNILFIPIIVLEEGLERLQRDPQLVRIGIKPVLTVPTWTCIKDEPSSAEDMDIPAIRTLVRQTADRVLQPLNELDDPPGDPFGYKGSGALIVTYHNTPNNTLALVHHKSPLWQPLFRRLHHSKDNL